ncbi:hypothetical protein H9Y04_32765 [Streptomyces sp. TRM66268-LWL]|uniref:Integral membrane protein n=1 Tax=Streptomyces polyasparticus TaxID=2767826 RepID=A0ABR7SS10_9ACTN|nr:hypothetical protein [Streptomyces polyasparticus]MBC9717311.1 hypothetical protein [Streptomyces polyasparticus]
MTTSSQPPACDEVLARRGGRLPDLTDVLWMDLVIYAAALLLAAGLLCWIGWGWLERRHGVRGAQRHQDERGDYLPGRRPRARLFCLALAAVGALVLLGFGAGLQGRSGEAGEPAGLLLGAGAVGLALCLVAGVFWRPRPWPERAGDDPRKKSSEESAEHVDPGGARSTHG